MPLAQSSNDKRKKINKVNVKNNGKIIEIIKKSSSAAEPGILVQDPRSSCRMLTPNSMYDHLKKELNIPRLMEFE